MENITAEEKIKSHDGNILSYVTLEYIVQLQGIQLIPGVTPSSSNDLLTPLSH